jgi:hypothetical protein
MQREAQEKTIKEADTPLLATAVVGDNFQKTSTRKESELEKAEVSQVENDLVKSERPGLWKSIKKRLSGRSGDE